jgi:hypothetical protein
MIYAYFFVNFQYNLGHIWSIKLTEKEAIISDSYVLYDHKHIV